MIASFFARNDKPKNNHTDVKKRKSLEIDNAYYPEFDTEIFILEQTYCVIAVLDTAIDY